MKSQKKKEVAKKIGVAKKMKSLQKLESPQRLELPKKMELPKKKWKITTKCWYTFFFFFVFFLRKISEKQKIYIFCFSPLTALFNQNCYTLPWRSWLFYFIHPCKKNYLFTNHFQRHSEAPTISIFSNLIILFYIQSDYVWKKKTGSFPYLVLHFNKVWKKKRNWRFFLWPNYPPPPRICASITTKLFSKERKFFW